MALDPIADLTGSSRTEAQAKTWFTNMRAWLASTLGGETVSAGAALRGQLAGLKLSNNGADATNDIDVAVGGAMSDDVLYWMTLGIAITKQLDAAWAVGTNQGMRDTGSIADGTWHIYEISRPDTGVVDILASLSASAPTMPTNYTKKRRIASILRAAGAIVLFIQHGDLFTRKGSAADVNVANPGIAAVTRTLSVPTGIRVEAVVRTGVRDSASAGAFIGILSDLDANDEAPGVANANFGTGQIDERFMFQFAVRTNTSAQIRSRIATSNATTSLFLTTVGWIDTRGRDD